MALAGRPNRPKIPEAVWLEALLAMLEGKGEHEVPVVLPAALWMFHGDQAGRPANGCVDACMALGYAYELFGIPSRVELLRVQVTGRGRTTLYGTERPHWNADGTLDGHAVLHLPEASLLVDATISQFVEVPGDSLIGRIVPIVAPFPDDVRFTGEDSITFRRDDHSVTYLPATGDADQLLAHPAVHEADAGYRQAGSNAAAQTLAMLRRDPLAEQFPTSPYPQLQRLQDELRDAEALVVGEEWVFRRPTGADIRLGDRIPPAE